MRFLASLFFLQLASIAAFSQLDGLKMQSVFIYSFTKYIHWETLGDEQFHIQVLGNKAMHLELSNGLGNKTINGKPIKITFVENESQITPCQILYVDNSFLADCTTIKEKLIANNTLLVTADLGNKGHYHNMNFVMNEQGKLALELHINKTKDLRIRVSSELAKMIKQV